MFLLDTSICIFLLKQRPPQVISRFRSYEIGQIKLSSITLAELEFGVANSEFKERNRIALMAFLSPFEILVFDSRDARVFGELRANLKKRGETIGPYDCQIAAQALARDLVLVTNNTREFVRVPSLKLEDWV